MPTLDWIGKDKVINHHNDVPYKVLERKYSYDEDGEHKDDIHSENMIIHGDNLEALKSLLPQYEGKSNVSILILHITLGRVQKKIRHGYIQIVWMTRR